MSVKHVSDRTTVQSLIEVLEVETGRPIGYLANYSPGGLMIIGKNQITKGTVIDCKMMVPDNMFSDREMTFTVEAVWCEEDIMPGDYTIGFKFQKITEEDFRLLVSINDILLTERK